MNNDRIVVLDGARTPIGSFGGMFKDVPGFELGAIAAKEALTRAGVEGSDIREVVMGCIGQVGPDAYNARRVAVTAGLPTNVPAYTVNRLCGSGLQAVWSAAMQMRWNDLDFTLARPPGRRHRREPDPPGRERHGPPRPGARHCHHVHRWRAGAGRPVQEDLRWTWCCMPSPTESRTWS